MMTSRMSIPTRPKLILGFDPGYERLGAALVEQKGSKENLIYSTCIRTPKSALFEERLLMIGRACESLIAEYRPTAVALEKVFLTKNQKTAMQIAEVKGVLTYIAAQSGLPLFEYTPLEVKVAVTGHGGSDKRQVADMVKRLVSLPAKKRLDDELDAIAIALTCLASTRSLA